MRGRLVRRLSAGTKSAGNHVLCWDGRDEPGRRAVQGVYAVRVSAAGMAEMVKALMLK